MDAKVFVNGQLASSTEMAWLVAAQVTLHYYYHFCCWGNIAVIIIIGIIIGIIVIIHTPTPLSLFIVTFTIIANIIHS